MFLLFLLLFLSACTSSEPKKSQPPSFYDQNLFFDLTTETENIPCEIQGKIPEWLNGTLLRNGPALFTAGKRRVNSWFDGLAMIHGFTFTPDKVCYSNRFLRTEQYKIMLEEGTLNFHGFAQDPCGSAFKNLVSRFFSSKNSLPNAVVSIADYAGHMVALTETPLPVVFDPDTLETIGGFHYLDELPKDKIFESAHPQFDPEACETINYLVDFGRKSAYVIWKMNGAWRHQIARMEVDLPAYMHSFAVTENHVILVEFPFVVNPWDLIKSGKPFIENYKWKPDLGTNFLVIDRHTGKEVCRIKGEPFFAFHHVNAYEEKDNIIMDIVTYADAEIIHMVSHETMEEKPFPKTELKRFSISLKDNNLKCDTLFNHAVEMPKVSAAKTAHPYRYCYAIDAAMPTSVNEALSLYKVDVQTGSGKSWSEKGCFPGEPIFVPQPGSEKEDEGVVLSLILDLRDHSSFLLVLDATSWKELARAKTPRAIPVGLHGYWKE